MYVYLPHRFYKIYEILQLHPLTRHHNIKMCKRPEQTLHTEKIDSKHIKWWLIYLVNTGIQI